MAHLYVGGFGFKNRYKDLLTACQNARKGDIIFLEKDCTIEGIEIDVPLTITTEKNAKIICSKERYGFLVKNVNLHFKDITLVPDAKSNIAILSDDYRQCIHLENVHIDQSLKLDPRDWYPPFFSKSPYAQCILENVNCHYFHFFGQQIRIKKSKIGHLYGPQSSIQTDHIEAMYSQLNNCLMIGRFDQALLNLEKIKSQGYLQIKHLTGTIDGLSYQLKHQHQKDWKFLDTSYQKEHLYLMTIDQCKALNIKDLRIKLKTPIDWMTFILKNSELLIQDTQIKLSPLKNHLENTQLKLENVDDQSQWIEFGTNKKSTTSLQREGGGKAFQRLQSMIGLQNVKAYLTEMISSSIVNQELKKRGLPNSQGFTLHQVFAGAAGSGKTTVAKLFGEALYEEGIIPTANFTIATRKDLVAEYVGQTAIKTHELIKKSRGGILFIDEAYSLRSKAGTHDFASEAVDQLVMDSEEFREDTIIILAGYTKEMEDFINNTNPGLKSRFKNWIEFPDYSLDELLQIIQFTLKDQGVFVRDITTLNQSFAQIFNQKGYVEGNGRFVRNYVQDLIGAKDIRTSKALAQGQKLSNKNLLTIENIDIEKATLKYKQSN